MTRHPTGRIIIIVFLQQGLHYEKVVGSHFNKKSITP